jgi:hypothetical protein
MNRFSFAEPRPASKQGSQWRPYSQRRTGYNIRRGIKSKMNISPWRILTKERKRVSLWSLLFWLHVGFLPLLSVSVVDGIYVCDRQISPMYEYLLLSIYQFAGSFRYNRVRSLARQPKATMATESYIQQERDTMIDGIYFYS